MNVRFFYSPAIFSNYPKLFVLTDDAILYSESRDYSVVEVERYVVTSFQNFDPKEYETEEHPVLLEVSKTEATEISDDLRPNWLNRYLMEKRAFTQESMPVW